MTNTQNISSTDAQIFLSMPKAYGTVNQRITSAVSKEITCFQTIRIPVRKIQGWWLYIVTEQTSEKKGFQALFGWVWYHLTNSPSSTTQESNHVIMVLFLPLFTLNSPLSLLSSCFPLFFNSKFRSLCRITQINMFAVYFSQWTFLLW